MTNLTNYEWAMLMYETYAKQNDCEQAECYYGLAQYFKEVENKKVDKK